MTAKTVTPNLDNLIELYNAGESLKQIALKAGCDRTTMRRQFVAAGVEIRGRSDAEFAKWRSIKSDRAKVVAQCSAAWDASRNKTKSQRTREAIAVACYRGAGKRIGKRELEIIDALASRGVQSISQWPVGAYNIDIAITASRLAVEIVGTSWNSDLLAIQRKRCEYLCGAGWGVLFVHVWRKSPGIIRGVRNSGTRNGVIRISDSVNVALIADYIVSLLDHSGGNKSFLGKYGMVDGHAKPFSGSRYNFDSLARIQ